MSIEAGWKRREGRKVLFEKGEMLTEEKRKFLRGGRGYFKEFDH